MVNPATAEISEIEFPLRYSALRLVNPATAEMSEIELVRNSSNVRLVAYSSPVKSLILGSLVLRWFKLAISEVVMVSPVALLNAAAIAARRLESGMSTSAPATISSNSTVTPLPRRAGICVSMETGFRGLTFTLILSPLPKPALATSAEMSDIEFLSRASHVSFVSPATAEMSEIEFLSRCSVSRLVNPATAEMSESEFLLRISNCSLVNPATTEISEIEFSQRFSAIRLVNSATAEMSEIELSERYRCVRLVNPVNSEMSEILLDPRYSSVKLVSPATAEMSEIKLCFSNSISRLVSPANAEMSEIELCSSNSVSRLVNPANAEMSEIELFQKSSDFRLVACSSPVKSLMLDFLASRRVNAAISDTVIVAPDVLPRAASIAARRFASGRLTVCAGAVNGIERHINRKKVKRKGCFVIGLSSLSLGVCARHLHLNYHTIRFIWECFSMRLRTLSWSEY